MNQTTITTTLPIFVQKFFNFSRTGQYFNSNNNNNTSHHRYRQNWPYVQQTNKKKKKIFDQFKNK